VVAAVRLARVHEITPRSIQVHVGLVPRLWLLKRRKRTRIFKGMRAPEIIEAMLEGAGISARWQLLRDHVPRAYVTPYEESRPPDIAPRRCPPNLSAHPAAGGASWSGSTTA
jgi:hypothetical protein